MWRRAIPARARRPPPEPPWCTPWLKNHRNAIGNLVQFLDKDRALGFQPIDHIAVVDYLMAHRRGRHICDRAFNNFNGSIDAGAKPRGAAINSLSGCKEMESAGAGKAVFIHPPLALCAARR
jgi:hypothetical protein